MKGLSTRSCCCCCCIKPFLSRSLCQPLRQSAGRMSARPQAANTPVLEDPSQASACMRPRERHSNSTGFACVFLHHSGGAFALFYPGWGKLRRDSLKGVELKCWRGGDVRLQFVALLCVCTLRCIEAKREGSPCAGGLQLDDSVHCVCRQSCSMHGLLRLMLSQR